MKPLWPVLQFTGSKTDKNPKTFCVIFRLVLLCAGGPTGQTVTVGCKKGTTGCAWMYSQELKHVSECSLQKDHMTKILEQSFSLFRDFKVHLVRLNTV